jgi:tRNA 2-thiocytidine biosynthesis protein TtcA
MYSLPTPPWSTASRRLESATRKALFSYNMLDGVSRLAVAVSGGKDSIALLSFLKAISGRGIHSFDLVCLHVSGDFSCGAQVTSALLSSLCRDNGITYVERALPPEYKPDGCYSCSRIRRKFLFEMAKEENCTTVAFGHHRDDSIQTLLMNLCHKGEFSGLLPKITLFKYGITIIRPLILVKEADIITFAKQHGLLRVTCSCPFGKDSFRKKTDGAIDVLESLYPHTRENLARAALLYGSQKAAHLP